MKPTYQTLAPAAAYDMSELTMSAYYPEIHYTVQPRRTRLAPLIAGAAMAAIVLAGQTRLGAWLRGYFSTSRVIGWRVSEGKQCLPAGDRRAFDVLREWLLGRNMAAIVDAFGPPRLMEMADATVSAVRDAGVGSFWRSDLWYYPIDADAQTAMAVRFAGGVVQQVDFFELAASV